MLTVLLILASGAAGLTAAHAWFRGLRIWAIVFLAFGLYFAHASGLPDLMWGT